MGEQSSSRGQPRNRCGIATGSNSLIAGTLLAGLCVSGCAFTPLQQTDYLIADFENPALSGAVWRSFPLRAHDELTASRTPVPAHEPQGHALQLDFRFADDSRGAIGYRLPLDDLNADDFDHLRVRLLAEPAGRSVASLAIELKRPAGTRPQMEEKGSYVLAVRTGVWQQIDIPLNRMVGLPDRRHLRNLVIVFNARRDGRRGRVSFDDIHLVRTGRPGPGIADRVPTPMKSALEAAAGGKDALQPALRERLRAWPGPPPDRMELTGLAGHAFLRRLAADTWRGLDALVDREHGVPIDNLSLVGGTRAMHVGDYTNVTNIGLHLMALVGAQALGYLDASQAAQRAEHVLRTLEKLETAHGFFYNYYDTTTLERTTNFISFVDSAWLTAGLMVMRNAMPEFSERCTRLIARGDFGFFYDDVELLMRQGYFTHMQAPSEYHYGALYAESRLGSLIAIGKHDVPAAHWYGLLRTFPQEYAWQTQVPIRLRAQRMAGHTLVAGLYQWGGLSFVPSWGGSMFEALMPVLVLDEMRYAPKSLGRNNAVHVSVQRRFATEILGYGVWGMSPSTQPSAAGYGEYGVRWLGTRGYSAGTVTPHAAALALLIEPAAATENLRTLASRYAAYGPFGFYDALDPVTGAVSRRYLALDQAMLFLALANHLCDHVIQKHFAADPITQAVLPMLTHENFWAE